MLRMPDNSAELYFPFERSECLCFTGHRVIPFALRKKVESLLNHSLRQSYEEGKRVFLSGGALGFDTLASLAVFRLKSVYPDIKLVIAVPCRSQSSRWSTHDREVYRFLLSHADQVIYVSEEYFLGCMQKRNRFLVDHADQCMCFLTQCKGGTWYTVSYAYDRGLKINNLALEL